VFNFSLDLFRSSFSSLQTTAKFIDNGFTVKLKLDSKSSIELPLQDAVQAARKMMLANVIYPVLHIARQQQAYLFLKVHQACVHFQFSDLLTLILFRPLWAC